MRKSLILTLLAAASIQAQAPTVATLPQAFATFLRETYTKFEYRIPMRDGLNLFAAVYIPKDVFTDGKSYPIMMTRTPYSVRPFGEDQYPTVLGPSDFFSREKFIFVYQDVRGRYLSEGEYVPMRPYKPLKNGPRDIDESSDTYDTIEWLLKNVRGNTAKVGVWGISQPGFFSTAALLDPHPALMAVSPQAPVTDYYLGDDSYHNGAFMLAHRFNFYQNFRQREGDPEPASPTAATPYNYGTPDGYQFFLDIGSLANIDEKYFKGKQPFWKLNVEHTTYDETWQSRGIWKYLKAIKPAVMTVGGWFDTEDPQGPLRMHDFMEKNTPPQTNMLVMGPWMHGGFSRGLGDRVGNVNFGSNTSAYYRERIEFPFFLNLLKGKADGKFPKAYVFETGTNQWRRFDAWPPREAKGRELFLVAKGELAWQRGATESFEEYIADTNKPVPYIGHISTGVRSDYMTEDQRFAAARPDVLVFKTPPLDRSITIAGPISVRLKVSTTGTDSDFVVKLIDVYPSDFPDFNAPPLVPGAPVVSTLTQPANTIRLGGYQQLVRGEPFRGKFRKSFEKPVAFQPGVPDQINFNMPGVTHTFRRGHRIMVQIQSSWFPLTDRNPQKFLDIPKASSADFVKATQRVFLGGAEGSHIQLLVIE